MLGCNTQNDLNILSKIDQALHNCCLFYLDNYTNLISGSTDPTDPGFNLRKAEEKKNGPKFFICMKKKLTNCPIDVVQS